MHFQQQQTICSKLACLIKVGLPLLGEFLPFWLAKSHRDTCAYVDTCTHTYKMHTQKQSEHCWNFHASSFLKHLLWHSLFRFTSVFLSAELHQLCLTLNTEICPLCSYMDIDEHRGRCRGETLEFINSQSSREGGKQNRDGDRERISNRGGGGRFHARNDYLMIWLSFL